MLEKEEALKNGIVAKFSNLEGKVTVQRARRVWVDVEYPKFRGLLEYLVNEKKLPMILVAFGLDEGENFGIVYSFAFEGGLTVNLKTHTPRANPVIHTITDIFPNALLYERELVDLFGIKVEGLPPGKRYPLPDNWPEGNYPLRKDWKPEMLGK